MESKLFFISTPHRFSDQHGKTISEKFYHILKNHGMAPKGIYFWNEKDLYDLLPTRFPYYNLMVLCDSKNITCKLSRFPCLKMIELPDGRWFDMIEMETIKTVDNGVNVFVIDEKYCKTKPESMCGEDFSHLFRVSVNIQHIDSNTRETVLIKPPFFWKIESN